MPLFDRTVTTDRPRRVPTTPQEIETARRTAAALSGQMGQTPVRSIPQGLNVLAQGALSGLLERRANEGQEQYQQQSADAMMGLLDPQALGFPNAEAMRTAIALNPQLGEALLGMQLELNMRQPEVRDPIKMGDHTLLDPNTYEVLWQAPADPAEAPEHIEAVGQDGLTHFMGWNPDTQQYDTDLGLVPANASNVNDFADVTALRNHFDSLTSEHRQVDASYRRILASGSDPSAAGDLSLIFNYMKMLDPNSVVRESEFATAAATGAFGQQIEGLVNRIISGERLADSVRDDFMQRATLLYEAARDQYEVLATQYTDLANQRGFDPSQVVLPWPSITEQREAQREAQQTAPAPPAVGEVRDGYRYTGGDPGDPNNWVPVDAGYGGNDPWQQLRGN